MSIIDKWNVPGVPEYDPNEPTDPILRSLEDQELRGYWLARAEEDGQACFVSNQNDADNLTVDVDVDGIPIIKYSDETTEFSYTPMGTVGLIRVRRYS